MSKAGLAGAGSRSLTGASGPSSVSPLVLTFKMENMSGMDPSCQHTSCSHEDLPAFHIINTYHHSSAIGRVAPQ